MEKLQTMRSIAKWGRVLLKIMEVFSIIGAVFVLLGLVCLALVPGDLMEVETNTEVNVVVNMAQWLGKDAWLESRDYVEESLKSEGAGEEVTVTDEGMVVTTSVDRSFNRADLALSIAPSILTLALTWFFCRTLGKLMKGIRDGGEPFTKENAALLRQSGIVLFVRSVAPWMVYNVVGIFSQVIGNESGIDLTTAFVGLMLLGLAALFEGTAARFNITAPTGFGGWNGTPGANGTTNYSGGQNGTGFGYTNYPGAPNPPTPPQNPQGDDDKNAF